MNQVGKELTSKPKVVNRGMTRRRFLGGALAGAGLLGLPGCGRFGSSSNSGGGGRASDTINVGVILPLSGGAAQAGQNARDGIRMIADDINKSGGIKSLDGAKINLKVADSTEEPATAATVAQRFISQNDVVAVLGSYSSSLSLAVSEVTERRSIPYLTMSYTDELTARGFKYLFQVTPKASVIGKDTFDYALDIGEAAGGQAIKRVALMYENTAYGTSQAEGLRKSAANANNIEVVMDEAFPFGITDASPLVNQLRDSNAQIVFPISGSADDSIKIVRGMRRQGLDTLIVGGSGGYVIPDFVDALGDLSEGVLSINTSNWDLAPDVTKEYKKQFGSFMEHEAIESGATMRVLAEALEKAGSTEAEEVRKALAANEVSGGIVNAMPGGRIKFDETGLNTVAFPIMTQWQEKELVTVYPKKVAKAQPTWPGVGE
jgi:branched-chain amino acid transport system substrate-binding protein